MQATYPGISPDPGEWKGQDITDFQEDLRIRVNGQLSEKWFYSHFKNHQNSLPRIDVLNLLSRYAAYQSWEEFKHRNGKNPSEHRVIRKGNRMFLVIPSLLVLIMAILYGVYELVSTRTYTFSFYDNTINQPVTGMKIQVQLLNDMESPTVYFSDSSGKVQLRTDRSTIRMVVSSPYFWTDTITRILKKFNTQERIGLRANEYALMLNYYSGLKVDDWEHRRARLDSIIDEHAVIYRVYGKNRQTGIELLNKEEFIDFLSLPSASLRQMEILDLRHLDGKIMILRYQINEAIQ